MEDKITDYLKTLPSLIQLKILNYYLIIQAEKKRINWPNELSRIRDFSLYCQLDDKLTNNGFVRLETSELKLVKNKFPNIQLNPNIEKKFIREFIMQCWKKFPTIADLKGMIPKKRNIQLVDDFFTQYRINNAFALEFKEYHQYFSLNQDYEIFFNGFKKKANCSKSYYFKLTDYPNRFHLVDQYNNNRSTECVDKLDMDCCNY